MRENGWKITIFNGKITIFNGKITIFNGKITIFNGKIHYFDWAIFNSYVNLPEGTEGIISIISYQLVMIVLVGIEIIVLRINDGGDES